MDASVKTRSRIERGLFLRTLDGERQTRAPLWMMRQAGRYLPEYREIRATASSFIDFCYTPRLAAEATLQPIRRFGFDAAILFCDILVVPDALGQSVSFETGEGPRLTPITSREEMGRLRATIDLDRLAPVFETIQRVRADLPAETALLGFCGAPWTVATYMIAGRGTPEQAPARLFAYRDREAFAALIDRLVEASATYLIAQLRAGVDAVQIFDSWAGVLPIMEYERWCVAPVAKLVDLVRAAVPDARIIAFPRGGGAQLARVAALPGVSAVSLNTSVDPAWANDALPSHTVAQGNLDPLTLIAGGQALDEAVDRILAAFPTRPHVFNLGHGILPETPIAHVEQMVARVRRGL